MIYLYIIIEYFEVKEGGSIMKSIGHKGKIILVLLIILATVFFSTTAFKSGKIIFIMMITTLASVAIRRILNKKIILTTKKIIGLVCLVITLYFSYLYFFDSVLVKSLKNMQ